MPFVANNVTSHDLRILIVCLRSEKRQIRRIVAQHASQDWERRGLVKILNVPDALPLRPDPRSDADRYHKILAGPVSHAVIEHINRCVPAGSLIPIFLIGRTSLVASQTERARRVVRTFTTPTQFAEFFPQACASYGIGWRQTLISQLAHLQTCQPIAESHIERWLSQFKQLGLRWEGESLLRLLDIWPHQTIVDALCDHSILEAVESCDFAVFGKTTTGESATVVSRIAFKAWHDAHKKKLRSVVDLVRDPQEKAKLLYLEDCILTGHECIKNIRMLRALAGFDGCSVRFGSAVATELGLRRVETFVRREGLSNVTILRAPHCINNLTPEAFRLMKVDRFFDHTLTPCNPSLVLNGISAADPSLLDASQKKSLTWVCRRIGQQLITNDLIRQEYPVAEATEMASSQSFGFGNLGLVTVFAHSIPDSLIPLFRLTGDVSFDGRSIHWTPLLVQKLP